MKRPLLASLLTSVLLVTAALAAALVYQCPMHPWIRSDRPAKCTICGMDLVAATTTAPVPEGLVSLAPTVIRTIGVETSVVARQPLVRSIRVHGTIEDDESRHRVLTAWAEGRVEQLHVPSVGAVLTAGTPWIELYSPELQAAQREFIQLARAGELAAAALPAARARLRRMGLDDAQLDEAVRTGEPTLITSFLAPEGGTVVRKDVFAGQWVKAGDRLLELGDFSRMWFIFEAYETDLPWLRAGQPVEITARTLPGEVITAPIDFIDPNLGETTRTAKVRVVLANPHLGRDGQAHPLRHRALAEARVRVETPDVLTAPRSAILDAGRGPVAYVDRGSGFYEARSLRLGRRGDTLVEVIAGLAPGERVVTTGALLLDGQAQLAREAAGQAAVVTSGSKTTGPATPAPAGLAELAGAAADAAAALAADDFPAYQRLFPRLAALAPGHPELPRLEPGADLKAARRSFEPWSTAVADQVRPHRTELGLTVYQCPMSPVVGKGRWVQRTTPLRNPFFGAAMASCGTELP